MQPFGAPSSRARGDSKYTNTRFLSPLSQVLTHLEPCLWPYLQPLTKSKPSQPLYKPLYRPYTIHTSTLEPLAKSPAFASTFWEDRQPAEVVRVGMGADAPSRLPSAGFGG